MLGGGYYCWGWLLLPCLPMPVSQRTIFWDFDPDFGRFWGRKKSPYFDYPTMLAVSGGLAPSFYWSPAFLKNPQKVAVIEDFVFFRKKSWAKMTILSPAPNVDRSPVRVRARPGPGHGRFEKSAAPPRRTHARLLSRAAGDEYSAAGHA